MIKDFIKSCWWEFLSYFVTQKQTYEIKGECKKCGKCCDTIYSAYTYSEKEFKFMQFIFPSYKRFYMKGKDEFGNIVFGCKYLNKNGLCEVYEKRPLMCRNYPAKKLAKYGQMPDGCGYKIIKKDFKNYLDKKSDF